jgi:hypothetical protein
MTFKKNIFKYFLTTVLGPWYKMSAQLTSLKHGGRILWDVKPISLLFWTPNPPPRKLIELSKSGILTQKKIEKYENPI